MAKGKTKLPAVQVLPKPDLGRSQSGRIAQAFLDVDLRNSHDGLLEAAKKKTKGSGVDVEYLPRGSYLVFINHWRNRFKLMAPARHDDEGKVTDWVICYYRSMRGKIDREILMSIPQIFKGEGTLAAGKEMNARLVEELTPRRIRNVTGDSK